MTYKKSRQDIQCIEIFKEDLRVTYDEEIYELMDKNSFKPLCYGYDQNNKKFYVYQDCILENVMGNRISATKIIIKDDLFFVGSFPLSARLECEGHNVLIKGYYSNKKPFSVYCRLFVKSDVDFFTQKKEQYKNIVDSLEDYNYEEE